MIIDQALLDQLSAQARTNPRLRQSYDLRNSERDNSQRMLNALEPGTVMPVHRHRGTSESIAVVRGKLVMRMYHDNVPPTEEALSEQGLQRKHTEQNREHQQTVFEADCKRKGSEER